MLRIQKIKGRLRELVKGGLCSDMAYLICFSWSHCSRTVHGNMKRRTMHGLVVSQTEEGILIVWASVCLCITEELLTTCECVSKESIHTAVRLSSMMTLSPSLFLLETRDTLAIFILVPRSANDIWAKSRKQTKGQKKSEIIDLMSASIRAKRGQEGSRGRRRERGWSELWASHSYSWQTKIQT